MPPVSEADKQLVHEDPGKLVRADCLCPVCLEIFLEPVTLPCTHTFCKACFLETVDKANMCCPLCRKRVSTWARLNSRNKTLVNVELWRRIQETFPAQCQQRLNDDDDDDDEDNMNALIPKPRVSRPGELRQEYEDQISKFVEEKRALEEAERKASEEYIQRLLAEEDQRVTEERRRQEERLEEDEKVARMLSKELNSSQVSESQRSTKQNDATSAKKKKSPVGHIEKFLCPVPYGQLHCDSSPTTTLMANKETILNEASTNLHCSAQPCTLDTPALTSCSLNSEQDPREQLSTTAETSILSSKRKVEDTGLAGESDMHKRPCSSSQANLNLQELALQEEALWSRWQQEEEDRRLALRLQRELDRENTVDRRKGSTDSYSLRQKTIPPPTTGAGPGGESGVGVSSALPSAAHVSKRRAVGEKAGKRVSSASTPAGGKTLKEGPMSSQASPSSDSPELRGTKKKQTTLTEMFPSLGN